MMVDRIIEILKSRNLSPAQFADMIGVQRSSISHLISGRNKPSLEFVQKILKTFPDIDVEWLLSGKSQANSEVPVQGMEETSQMQIFPTEVPFIEKPVLPKKSEPEKFQKKKAAEPGQKKIEKIVFFYNDNTFREYYPE
jgi:transcriptional regulator with XRE-family HTH domain